MTGIAIVFGAGGMIGTLMMGYGSMQSKKREKTANERIASLERQLTAPSKRVPLASDRPIKVYPGPAQPPGGNAAGMPAKLAKRPIPTPDEPADAPAWKPTP